METRFQYDNQTFLVRREEDGSTVVIAEGGEPVRVRVHADTHGNYTVHKDAGAVVGEAARSGDKVWVRWQGRTYSLDIQRGSSRRSKKKPGGDLSSPMPGQVVKHLAKPGSEVQAGEALLVVEAMKMQLEITAPNEGILLRFLHDEGEQIEAGVPLAEMESAD